MAANHLSTKHRSLIGKAVAFTRWAGTTKDERRAATSAATKGREASWARKADPEGRMTPEELAEAVERMKKAHYARMQLASAQARTGRKATTA
jgi:hypothetical protein